MVTFALCGTAAVGAATVRAAMGGGGVVPAEKQALARHDLDWKADDSDKASSNDLHEHCLNLASERLRGAAWRQCVSSAPSDLMAASARAWAAASCALLLFAALVRRAATTFCWISEVSLRDRLCEAGSKPLIWGRGPGLPASSSMLALPRSLCADAVAASPRIRADSATWACMTDLNRPIWRRRAMTVQAMRGGFDAAAVATTAAQEDHFVFWRSVMCRRRKEAADLVKHNSVRVTVCERRSQLSR